MLCPICLGDHRFRFARDAAASQAPYRCEELGDAVPPKYVREYRQAPPIVLSAIGFRGHGKTVYFASLLHSLERLAALGTWPGFYTMSLDDESVRTVRENVALLEGGRLPYSTPKNFPRPTLLRLERTPLVPRATLLCYDAAGEVFAEAREIGRYARFVRRAGTAMLLVSLADLANPAREMHELLNTYVLGLAHLGAAAREQNLLVVFTKADEQRDLLAERPALAEYLRGGTLDGLGDMRAYLAGLQRVSDELLAMTGESLGARSFLSLADSHFRAVRFSIVSSLGSRPEGGAMAVGVTPRRVLDPLLWLLAQARTPWRMRRA